MLFINYALKMPSSGSRKYGGVLKIVSAGIYTRLFS
jgi:hypothetical protein